MIECISHYASNEYSCTVDSDMRQRVTVKVKKIYHNVDKYVNG